MFQQPTGKIQHTKSPIIEAQLRFNEELKQYTFCWHQSSQGPKFQAIDFLGFDVESHAIMVPQI